MYPIKLLLLLLVGIAGLSEAYLFGIKGPWIPFGPTIHPPPPVPRPAPPPPPPPPPPGGVISASAIAQAKLECSLMLASDPLFDETGKWRGCMGATCNGAGSTINFDCAP